MAEPLDAVLTSDRVVLPDGAQRAAIGIRDGRIAWTGPADAAPDAARRDDLGRLALLPGVVDTHVHVNDPGTDWEGFASAGRAAAAGGITTLVDMPLNSLPVTTTVAALECKRRAAAVCAVDCGFWGGVVPGNEDQLDGLAAAGVLGFKCFLAPSGLPEFPAVNRRDLDTAMPILARHGLPLLVHAEDPQYLDPAAAPGRSTAAFVETRPPAAEVAAIEMLANLAERWGGAVHVVHISSTEGAEAVAQARHRGVSLTAETCPHYLTFAAEEIGDGRCEFKCAPPIRDARHRKALWEALEAGALDLVASDHSPCPPAMKHLDRGDYGAAWGGIASLQLSLPAVWTGLRARGGSLAQLARWMCAAPAELAGVDGAKGRIEVGFDADLVIFDPEAGFVVDAHQLQHRHPLTPYAGRHLQGVVERTLLRGSPIYHRPGAFDETRGRLLG